jgi:hypothetical protein
MPTHHQRQEMKEEDARLAREWARFTPEQRAFCMQIREEIWRVPVIRDPIKD